MRLFRISSGRGFEVVSLPAEGVVPLGVALRLVLSVGAGWVLLATEGVAVNGYAALPAVVLAEGDEIRAAGQRFVLGPRMDAPVESAAVDSKTCCARCASALRPGAPVLLCPECRAAHHPECWDYAPQCSGCGREITADWRPK